MDDRKPLTHFRSYGYFDGLLDRQCTPADDWDPLEKEMYLKGYTLGWEERERAYDAPSAHTGPVGSAGDTIAPRMVSVPHPKDYVRSRPRWEHPQPGQEG